VGRPRSPAIPMRIEPVPRVCAGLTSRVAGHQRNSQHRPRRDPCTCRIPVSPGGVRPVSRERRGGTARRPKHSLGGLRRRNDLEWRRCQRARCGVRRVASGSISDKGHHGRLVLGVLIAALLVVAQAGRMPGSRTVPVLLVLSAVVIQSGGAARWDWIAMILLILGGGTIYQVRSGDSDAVSACVLDFIASAGFAVLALLALCFGAPRVRRLPASGA